MAIGFSLLSETALAKSVKYQAPLAISSVIAQVPPPSNNFRAGERSIDEELILEMRLGDFLLTDGIFGFANQGSLLLPLTDFVRALDFPINVDPDNGRAEGWFMSENRLFSLDLAAAQVVIAGERVPLTPGLIEQQPSDIYVDVRTLAQWFPIDIKFELSNLLVLLTSREPLPLEARLARQQRREEVISQRRIDQRDLPRKDVPYQWITWPVSDTTIDFIVNSTDTESTISRRYNTLATADLLKLNADFFISGTNDDQISVARLKLGRQDARGGLLGRLDATNFAVGDIFGPQITHMTRTAVGRGFTFGNDPIGADTEFDSVTLQGDLQLGWEVELYRNEVLLDFRESQTNGRYLFEDVPLLFGVNVIRLAFYGPQGQQREEIQQIRVGADQLKPGTHAYSVSFNQQDRLLLMGDDEDQSTDGFQGKSRYTAQYKYGVNKALSVGGNVASIPFEGGHRQYIGANLVASLGQVYGRLDVTRDVSKGWAGTLSAQTRLFGASILGEHTILRDFFSEEFEDTSNPRESESRLRLDGVIRLNPLPHVPYAFNITRQKDESGDVVTNVENRLSTAVSRASISNTLSYTLNQPAETASSDTLTGVFQLGGRIGEVRTRGQVAYNVHPEQELTSATLTGDWRVNPRFNGRAGISKSLTGSQLTTYTGGINTNLEYVAMGIDGSVDDMGDYSGTLSLTYSWGKDAADGGLRLASTPTAERGTVTARVFRDVDGDGRFTQGTDEPLKGIRFRSQRTEMPGATNEMGIAFVTGLDTYKPVSFEIDEASLEDPFSIADPEGVEITLRPGVPGEVNFLIVTTGEIDGVVYRNEEGISEPTADVIIQLLDDTGTVVKETRSQFDGFFLLDFIRPGTYSLRIDPAQLERVRLPAVESRQVTIGQDGTILNGEDFLIGADQNKTPTFRAYLAAFSSVENAQDAWTTIQAELPAIFADVAPEYLEAPRTPGAPTVIELYASPFADRKAAEIACIELRATYGDTWCNPMNIGFR